MTDKPKLPEKIEYEELIMRIGDLIDPDAGQGLMFLADKINQLISYIESKEHDT